MLSGTLKIAIAFASLLFLAGILNLIIGIVRYKSSSHKNGIYEMITGGGLVAAVLLILLGLFVQYKADRKRKFQNRVHAAKFQVEEGWKT